ncbi:MAG: 4Fe-4S binding protein, partial [Mailhella sp.]|nr:4Fe-4S binding protein [Mailhella sp.]
AVFCDRDVDVPDLHIILSPAVRESGPFMGGAKASVRSADCISCGTCLEACRFSAVRRQGSAYSVDEALCEGCGVCAALCPAGAIGLEETACGEWYVSDTRFGPFVHAALKPGQENSGRLVSLLKRKAREVAAQKHLSLILCDGSPGIGCPVISSLAEATLAVAVVEPSLSGLHDFERVAGVCRHFRIPVGVVVNRWDLNPEGADAIERACLGAGHDVFGRVPFDAAMIQTANRRLAATECDTPLARCIRGIWDRIAGFAPGGRKGLAPAVPPAKLL